MLGMLNMLDAPCQRGRREKANKGLVEISLYHQPQHSFTSISQLLHKRKSLETDETIVTHEYHTSPLGISLPDFGLPHVGNVVLADEQDYPIVFSKSRHEFKGHSNPRVVTMGVFDNDISPSWNTKIDLLTQEPHAPGLAYLKIYDLVKHSADGPLTIVVAPRTLLILNPTKKRFGIWVLMTAANLFFYWSSVDDVEIFRKIKALNAKNGRYGTVYSVFIPVIEDGLVIEYDKFVYPLRSISRYDELDYYRTSCVNFLLCETIKLLYEKSIRVMRSNEKFNQYNQFSEVLNSEI